MPFNGGAHSSSSAQMPFNTVGQGSSSAQLPFTAVGQGSHSTPTFIPTFAHSAPITTATSVPTARAKQHRLGSFQSSFNTRLPPSSPPITNATLLKLQQTAAMNSATRIMKNDPLM